MFLGNGSVLDLELNDQVFLNVALTDKNALIFHSSNELSQLMERFVK